MARTYPVSLIYTMFPRDHYQSLFWWGITILKKKKLQLVDTLTAIKTNLHKKHCCVCKSRPFLSNNSFNQ